MCSLGLLTGPTADASTSNPAFLGVGMQDLGTNGSGPCSIVTITKDSGAHAAGLRIDDVFVAIDGVPVANCNALITEIQAREAGTSVDIRVSRARGETTITAKLLSRADVLRQRIVGQTMPISTLVRVDTEQQEDLSSRGETTIVGWFDQRRCRGCEQVFATIARWARKHSRRGTPITAVAATVAGDNRSLFESIRELKPYERALDVPLLVADRDTFLDVTITDVDRIHFMVIDSRGIVQYVAPLLPDADDKAAVLEELFAAAEQTARRK